MNAKDVILARKLGGGGGGAIAVEWHQCPELVRNYLANVVYDPADYTISYIDEYAPATAVVSNTKPIGKTVDGVTYYNEIPNVATPFSSTSEAGTLKPLDKLRWLNTTAALATGDEIYPKGINTRDLGGWACDGGTVKYGMLVRGGEPNEVDKDLMTNIVGIKSELYLLPISEQKSQVSAWGVDMYYNPTQNDFIWYDITHTDLWRFYLRTVFDSVSHGKPLYFHCGIGADRTGTVAVMLLALLGVSQSDIDKDYELTNFYVVDPNSPRRRNVMQYRNYISAIKAVPIVGGLSDTFANRAISFALSLGFTAAEINAFRTAMIDGTPTAISVSYAHNFSVSKTATHAAIVGNNAVIPNTPYEAVITPDNGYELKTIAITMGGVNIKPSCYAEEKYPSNIGKISIPAVTGDIAITATAEAEAPAYTNHADPSSADWKAGYRLNSSGDPVAASGKTVCNFIPCAQGDVIYIKGTPSFDTSGADRIAILSASKSSLDTQYTNVYLGNPTSTPTGYMRKISEGYYEFHVTSATAAYLRASFDTPSVASDIIITRNEVIE